MRTPKAFKISNEFSLTVDGTRKPWPGLIYLTIENKDYPNGRRFIWIQGRRINDLVSWTKKAQKYLKNRRTISNKR